MKLLFFNTDNEQYKPYMTKARLFLITRLIKETLRERPDLPRDVQFKLKTIRKAVEHLLARDGDYLLLTLRMLKMGYSIEQTKYSLNRADVIKDPISKAGVYELRNFLENKKLNSSSEDDNESFRPFVEEVIGLPEEPSETRAEVINEINDNLSQLSDEELDELAEKLRNKEDEK